MIFEVMIWNPFERFLWGIAITIALVCVIFFVHISRKRENLNEKLIMLGLAGLILGFALSLLFTFFQAFELPGGFEGYTFMGEYPDNYSLEYFLLAKGSYSSFAAGSIIFLWVFERITKRTKYILSSLYVIALGIELIALDLAFARIMFNILIVGVIILVPLVLYCYTKWSNLEFKAVSSFLLLGFILLLLSLFLTKRAHKNLNFYFLEVSPLLLMLGCCIILLAIVVKPKFISRALSYWISLAIIAFSTLLLILILDLVYGLGNPTFSPWYIVEFIGAFVYLLVLSILIIKDIKFNLITKKTEELVNNDDFLGMFTRPERVGFLAEVSHELKTPLTSIIGFARTLLKGWAGEINKEQEEQLSLILNSSIQLNGLIDDLIDISKIDSNRLEISSENFDLIEELNELKKEFSISAEDKGLKIFMRSPAQLQICTDRRRIHQILVNLIGNAIKFTDEGNIIIKARLSDDKIKISIKDAGIGIKEEDLSKLFKPFSRIVDPGNPKEGSGLGLHLSKKLAKLLGGDIIVKSQYRKGSTFKLVFDSTKC